MNNFTSSKDLYIKKLGMNQEKENTWDPFSKYAKAARNGLCFKCFYDGADPNRRPRHQLFAYCPQCLADMKIGVERVEASNWQEVNKWFKDSPANQ